MTPEKAALPTPTPFTPSDIARKQLEDEMAALPPPMPAAVSRSGSVQSEVLVLEGAALKSSAMADTHRLVGAMDERFRPKTEAMF